jgi:hypothetical protein
MLEDKTKQLLIEALRQAQAEAQPQRLYKSGKLPGLFAARTGNSGEAAAEAVRAGLLEIVRTETRGKTAIEWVMPTPRVVDFLHNEQSSVHALEELRTSLRTAQQGIPTWLGEMRQELHSLCERLTEEAERMTLRLETLNQRVNEALRRLMDAPSELPDGMVQSTPWAANALTFLDRRRMTGSAAECPLPELFRALVADWSDLSITAFHDGLRRLQDHRLLRLLPFGGRMQDLPQPEYALLEGSAMLYYACR